MEREHIGDVRAESMRLVGAFDEQWRLLNRDKILMAKIIGWFVFVFGSLCLLMKETMLQGFLLLEFGEMCYFMPYFTLTEHKKTISFATKIVYLPISRHDFAAVRRKQCSHFWLRFAGSILLIQQILLLLTHSWEISMLIYGMISMAAVWAIRQVDIWFQFCRKRG